MFVGDFFVEEYSDADVAALLAGKSDVGHGHADLAPNLITEVVADATGSLSVADVSGTMINNVGQAAENTQTLPAAASGMNFIAMIGTAGAGAFHLKAGAGDKIYLDGTALDDADKASCATPAVGDYITFWTFQTGAATYDWVAAPGQGDWADGGA